MATDSFGNVWCGALLLLVLLAAATAPAQEATTRPAAADPNAPGGAEATAAEAAAAATAPATASVLPQNWRDFIHYLRIARSDAALSYGKAILESNPDPAEVYRLSVQTENYIGTLQRAEKLPGLAQTIQAIRQLVEAGYRKVNRDPQQIAHAIEMLAGNLRQTMIGSERLLESGEYAVPQLVARLEDPQAPVTQKDRIAAVLARMGLPAVRPLCVALATSRPDVRIVLCQALGKIGYWHSAPYLRRLLAAGDLDSVNAAAEAALSAVTGDPAAGAKPVAGYFYQLAEKYYAAEESIVPDARYDLANVWYWQEGLGLVYKEVSSAIFLEVYAMRSAREALEADPDYSPAVSLWLAANLRKEAKLPDSAADPTIVPGQQSAEAYAKAAGARYLQEVLARALKDRDSAVARGAIKALAVTAGAENLVRPAAGGVTPLVSALSFPDQRVRFMAAEALASARPLSPFEGDELVLTVLIDALRQTGQPTVLLIEPDMNARNQYKEMIRQSGYQVVDGGSLAEGVEAMRQTTGVDLAVIGSGIAGPGPAEALGMLRSEATTSTLAVLFVARPGDLALVRRLAREDALVSGVEAPDLDLAKLQAAMKAAAGKAVPTAPMEQQEAAQWALKAARLVRLLGLTRTPVFDLNRAEPALTAALRAAGEAAPEETPQAVDVGQDQRIACAAALAVLNSGTAQQAIVELARSQAPQAVRIAAYQAAAESVRQIGNQLTGGQASSIVKVVMADDASPALRDAASELLGALDLPSEQIKSLITATK